MSKIFKSGSVVNIGNYSTTLIPTGRKWTDGKPIYALVKDVGAVTISNGENKYSCVISNVSTVVNCSYSWLLNRRWQSSMNLPNQGMYDTNGYFDFYIEGSLSVEKLVFIVEVTLTTD